METFSRDQQGALLVIIFVMTLIYLHSIKITDTDRSFIPSKREAESGQITAGSLPSSSPVLMPEKLSGAQLLTMGRRIDINKASLEDLAAVPGIGPKTAESIIAYRVKNGRFRKTEEVMKVRGIKGKRYEKIRKYLIVE